jgi:tetratricopeptide (TPR) repeat protein
MTGRSGNTALCLDTTSRAGLIGLGLAITLALPPGARAEPTAPTATAADIGAPAIPSLSAQRSPARPATANIRLQSAEHPGFSRIVANWRDAAGYTVRHGGNTADITFDGPARLDLEELGPGLKRIDGATVTVAGNRTTLRLAIRPGDVLRDFRLSGHVIVDVIDPDAIGHLSSVDGARITRPGGSGRPAIQTSHDPADDDEPPAVRRTPMSPPSVPPSVADHADVRAPIPPAGGRRPLRGLDLAGWDGSSIEMFVVRRRALETAAATAETATDRTRARLDLARFFLAHGFAAECLGTLDAVDRDWAVNGNGKRSGDDAVAALLRGAALLMAGRSDKAIEVLSVPTLDGQPEARLWRLAAHVARGVAPDRPLHTEADWLATIERYPLAVRAAVGPLAVEGAIASGDRGQAKALLAQLADTADTAERAAWLGYLDGLLLAAGGDHAGALERWRAVEATNTRRARAWALFRRVDMTYGHGDMTADDAIDTLETVALTWRADRLDVRIHTRLADIHAENGAFEKAFEALRNARDADPQQAAANGIANRLSALLDRLLIGDLKDTLSPFEAEVLYRRNEALALELDRSRLAEARTGWLARLDLVDPAAALLHERIEAATIPADRARLGAERAELMMRVPNADRALSALADTETPDIDPPLAERRRHLKARALAANGQGDDALTLLIGDDSVDALAIRAQVARDRDDWPAAVTLRTRQLNADETPEDGALSVAAAAVLAGDQAQLNALWGKYGDAMAATPSAAAFGLLAGPSRPPIAETASVAEATDAALRFHPTDAVPAASR